MTLPDKAIPMQLRQSDHSYWPYSGNPHHPSNFYKFAIVALDTFSDLDVLNNVWYCLCGYAVEDISYAHYTKDIEIKYGSRFYVTGIVHQQYTITPHTKDTKVMSTWGVLTNKPIPAVVKKSDYIVTA